MWGHSFLLTTPESNQLGPFRSPARFERHRTSCRTDTRVKQWWLKCALRANSWTWNCNEMLIREKLWLKWESKAVKSASIGSIFYIVLKITIVNSSPLQHTKNRAVNASINMIARKSALYNCVNRVFVLRRNQLMNQISAIFNWTRQAFYNTRGQSLRGRGVWKSGWISPK